MKPLHFVENIALLGAAVFLIYIDSPWWAILCFLLMNYTKTK